MFKKQENDYQTPEPPVINIPIPRSNPVESRRESATIGPSISIKGDLTGEEDLVIQGRVEGKIDLKQNNVTVGKNGRIKADIYAKLVTIEGEVDGNLFGQDQIVVRGTANVRGNISAPRVSIEDGARFKGGIDMGGKTGDQQRAPVPAESKSSVPGAAQSYHTPRGGQSAKIHESVPSPQNQVI